MSKCLEKNCSVADGIQSDGYCRKHHVDRKLEYWLDNTNPDDLGIVRWAKDNLPHYVYNDTPSFHISLYCMLLDLYDPAYQNKYQRLRLFKGFRGSAKSSAANTVFTLYVIANNNKTIRIKKQRPIIDIVDDEEVITYREEIVECKIQEHLIAIISETATQAEEFTVRIRDEIKSNRVIKFYYKIAIQNLENSENKWTRTDFKFNDCAVIALGTGQQIRGKVKGFSRPTLIIFDDLYSEKSVITQESRDKIKAWFFNAAMNSLDDLKGKAILLGTILHDDTVLVLLSKNKAWKQIEVPLMSMDMFHKLIEDHIKFDWSTNSAVLPFDEVDNEDLRLLKQKEYFADLQKKSDWKLSWGARLNLLFIAQKYQSAVFERNVDGFYQEYFHRTKSPFTRQFKDFYFQSLKRYEFKRVMGYLFIRFPEAADIEFNRWQSCVCNFGVDLSSGQGKDFAVITVTLFLTKNRIVILKQFMGKWSIRDNSGTMADKTSLSRSNLKSVGIADECYRLSRDYYPTTIKVGVASDEGSIRAEIERVFNVNGDYSTTILARPQTKRDKDKETRIATTLLNLYEAMRVWHCGSLPELEYQLEYLGKSDNDDHADSLECSVWMHDEPEEVEYSEITGVSEEEEFESERIPDDILSTIDYDWRSSN
jgi:hypothetical protein